MTENKNSSVHFFCGLLVGTALGAATAVLLAPDSGANTRTAIKERANACKDRLSTLAGEYRERIVKLSEEYKDKLTELRAEMQERFSADHAIQEGIAAAEANIDTAEEDEDADSLIDETGDEA